MDSRGTRTQSPAPSPHGAIGEVPGGISSSGDGHRRNSSLVAATAARPRTPAQQAAAEDDLDLSALISHGQRQLDLDRSRFGRLNNIQSAPTSARLPVRGRGLEARPDSPSRFDEWRESGSRSRDTSMHRQSSNGPQSLFNDQPFPSPIGQPRGSVTFPAAPPSSDPAAAFGHHLAQLSTLLNPMIAQSDEVIRLRAEVELWRGEWQRCDRERRRLDNIVKSEDPAKGRSKFSVALLDGDGLIFQDEHLRGGFSGGAAAARALMSALPRLCGRVARDGDSEPTGEAEPRELGKVLVHIFLNKHGLGNTLVKSGSVPSWQVYDSFWQGFTSAHDLFSVVDVGHGKEGADAKIREHLKLYAGNLQCGTVVLGVSHDNSYASVLSSLETTHGLQKLVILQGYSDLAPQLLPYSNRCVSLTTLFRETRIATTVNGKPKPRRASKPTTAQPPPPVDAGEHDLAFDELPSEDEVQIIEWDSPNTASRPPVQRRAASFADDDKGKKKPAVRSPTVPTVRNLKPRPCHTFYLSPWGCKNGDECEYAHHYKLNEDQTGELARLAKEIICPYVRSKRCHFREEECVYGHRCPRGERCTFGDTCRFKDLPNGHGEDSKTGSAGSMPSSPLAKTFS